MVAKANGINGIRKLFDPGPSLGPRKTCIVPLRGEAGSEFVDTWDKDICVGVRSKDLQSGDFSEVCIATVSPRSSQDVTIPVVLVFVERVCRAILNPAEGSADLAQLGPLLVGVMDEFLRHVDAWRIRERDLKKAEGERPEVIPFHKRLEFLSTVLAEEQPGKQPMVHPDIVNHCQSFFGLDISKVAVEIFDMDVARDVLIRNESVIVPIDLGPYEKTSKKIRLLPYMAEKLDPADRETPAERVTSLGNFVNQEEIKGIESFHQLRDIILPGIVGEAMRRIGEDAYWDKLGWLHLWRFLRGQPIEGKPEF